MLDKDRVLAKIDELDSYLDELKQIAPSRYDEYLHIEKKRSCERLLQLCIECVIDVCKLIVVQSLIPRQSRGLELTREPLKAD